MNVNFVSATSVQQSPAALTLSEFAKLFGKKYLWAYRLAKKGKLKTITNFGATMVPKEEALRILNEASFSNRP